jgi:hypothetical protein
VVLSLDEVSTFITDDGARESDLEPIRRAGVNVIVAKVDAEDAGGSSTSGVAASKQ